jgi:hypothetical protein
VLLLLLPAGPAIGQPGLLGPEDTAIAIDFDSTFTAAVPPALNGRYPGGESPPMALDGVTTTKYLNFGGAGSGFIITPAFASLGLPVESFRITTANDAATRDPATWALYGHNGPLVTTSSGPDPAINPNGMAESWTLIEMGAVALPPERQTLGPVVNVATGPAYDHYKMIFPTTKGSALMQIADIQFYLDDAATLGQELLQGTDAIIGVDEVPAPGIPAQWGGPAGAPGTSNFPAAESPATGIDQVANAMGQRNTKYLNFGEERSGIIVTNSGGPVDVNFMRLWTANDAVERDPTSYELSGTNSPITSEQNSNSNGTEVWTPISSGPLSLSDTRFTPSGFIPINSPVNYSSYRLVFPTVKNAATANSMQIADIQFYTAIPEPCTMLLVSMAGLALAAVRRRM